MMMAKYSPDSLSQTHSKSLLRPSAMKRVHRLTAEQMISAALGHSTNGDGSGSALQQKRSNMFVMQHFSFCMDAESRAVLYLH